MAREYEIVYSPKSGIGACKCGSPDGHPVVVDGIVTGHLCQPCWDAAVVDMAQKKAQYEALIADGMDPRMAERVMMGKK